jgi:hypothetical protein
MVVRKGESKGKDDRVEGRDGQSREHAVDKQQRRQSREQTSPMSASLNSIVPELNARVPFIPGTKQRGDRRELARCRPRCWTCERKRSERSGKRG